MKKLTAVLVLLTAGIFACDGDSDSKNDPAFVQYNSGNPLVFKKGAQGEFLPEKSDSVNITEWKAEGALPDWVSFDVATGAFSGTPSEYIGRDMAPEITVTAVTDKNESVSVTVLIGADDPPVIIVPAKRPGLDYGVEDSFFIEYSGVVEYGRTENLFPEYSLSYGEIEGKVKISGKSYHGTSTQNLHTFTLILGNSWGEDSKDIEYYLWPAK